MALSKHNTHVKWSSAAYSDVTSASNDTSDTVNVDESAIKASLSIYCDNQGTPAAGDEIYIKVLYSLGDTDTETETTDIFDTDENVMVSYVIDTNATGDGNAQATIPINDNVKAFKVFADNQSAGRTIRVYAKYRETRAT